jgi:hypothetical protein
VPYYPISEGVCARAVEDLPTYFRDLGGKVVQPMVTNLQEGEQVVLPVRPRSGHVVKGERGQGVG